MLDIYNRAFHETRVSRREFERNGTRVIEERAMIGSRLRVSLRYERDGVAQGGDVFEWRLYSAPEIIAEANAVGLELVLGGTQFDESCTPSETDGRMQLVFTKKKSVRSVQSVRSANKK